MSNDSSLVWAAYAAGIATLSGITSQNLGPNQVFAIAPSNSFSIPVTPYVNNLYQNWAVYEFASVVPEPGIPVFTPSGQSYDEAYALYLDNVFFQIPNDPALEAEINQTAAELTSTRATIQSLLTQALASFRIDVPNGISLFTGEPSTFAEYEALLYPDIADNIASLTAIEATRNELLAEKIGTPTLNLLNTWRTALSQAQSTATSFPNYNFGVLQADSPTIMGVVDGSTGANNNPTSYYPAYTIGGNFNGVAQQWINTFPSSYPGSTAAYDAGATKYTISSLTTTDNNWSQYGYSSATQYTGSSGWLFWSESSETTTTTTTNIVDISQSDFGSEFTVSAWGIGKFPVSPGRWYQGNPLVTWPHLVNSAPNTTATNVQQQITSVVLGYGIQVKFTLTDTAYNYFNEAVNSARSSSGSISIFGFLYGNGGNDYTSTYNDWTDIQTSDNDKSVTLLAQNVKVPQILGTIITKLSTS